MGIITSEKRGQIILALDNPKLTAMRIAVQFGVSESTVRSIAKKAGTDFGSRWRRRKAEKRAEIIDALKANPNASAVARQLDDVSYETVWNIAKRAGIELAGRGDLRPERRAQIIAELKTNPNAKGVARQGGASYGTVRNIAKRAGIELTAGKAARGRPPLPTKKRAQIIAGLKANPNATAVARQVGGVSRSMIGKTAKQAGIELAAGRPPLPTKKRAQIIAALKANPNATAVAREVGGVSIGTVWGIAKQAGIELAAGKAARGGHHQPPSGKRKKIIDALKANPNATAVARQVGDVSYETVRKIARREGIELGYGAMQRAHLKRGPR